MAAPGTPPVRLPAGIVVWLLGIGALPLLELGLLSAAYDASTLAARDGWVAHLIGASGDVVRSALPVVVAALFVGVSRRATLRPALLAAYGSPPARPWAALAGHLALFGVLFLLSGRVFGVDAPGMAALVAWVMVGVGSAALWFAALIPDLLRRGPGSLLGSILLAGSGVGLLAAGAAAVTRAWWQPLGRSTVWTVHGLLWLVGYDVGAEPDGFLVGTPTFVVEITPYCAGYQGIGLMWVFLGAYLWLFRDRLRFPRALWLLPLGTILVWVLNALRIAVLVAIGSHGHEDVAMQGFHYHAGTLFFCAAALGLGAWASSSRAFGEPVAGSPRESVDATAAYVLPFVALLLTALATGSLSRGDFDPFYGVRLVLVGAVLWHFRGALAGADWGPSWLGAAYGAVAFVVWLALAGENVERGAALGEGLAALDPVRRVCWIALRLAGGVVLVPVVEELAFRGYLARRLTAARFDAVSLADVSWPALLGSAALFGLLHGDVLAGAAAGVLYGLAARQRGRLGDAVAAHAVTNGSLAALALATGRWSFWA